MVDLLNASSCGIFSFSDEGIILQANTAICSILETEKENLVNQKVDSIFTIPTRIFFETHLYPLLKVEQQLDEIFITLKSRNNKQVPVVVSIRRKEDLGITETICSCLTVHNRSSYEAEIIAARKEAERALQANTALQDAQRRLEEHVALLDEKMLLLQQYNEMLKEISYTVSHELQEPVRKLNLFTDLLSHDTHGVQTAFNEKKIVKQIQRIKEILSGLQHYIWLEDDQTYTTDADLNAALEEALARIKAQYSEVPLSIHTSTLPQIKGDYKQFVALFYELLSNAVNFRSPEKQLRITVEAVILKRNQIRLLPGHYAYREHLKIDFTDNGTGFDQQYANYVFQLFKKLDGTSAGSGIGLTLCRKIVMNHGGTINVTSTEGTGTTFTIFLPVSAGI